MFVWSKKPTPKEQARQWIKELRKQKRGIERSIREVEREEAKVRAEIQREAKANRTKNLNVLAKSMVKCKKTASRLYDGRAQVDSCILQIKEQESQLRVVGAMQQNARIMHTMSRMINVPQIAQTARTMAKEMARAGIISEMVEDTFEALDDDELEQEADEEVAKVLYEITDGQFGKIAAIEHTDKSSLEQELEQEESEMDARLAKLHS